VLCLLKKGGLSSWWDLGRMVPWSMRVRGRDSAGWTSPPHIERFNRFIKYKKTTFLM
jgi:hypothetical protein